MHIKEKEPKEACDASGTDALIGVWTKVARKEEYNDGEEKNNAWATW